ncbi:hypothetical protein RCL1_004650 [Eukaryota sp. TZLM3-RCL]
MDSSQAQPDSYLLRVRTLIKKRRKLFFGLGVLTACAVLLPVIAYLLFVPHQVLAFELELINPDRPDQGSWKISLDLKHKITRFEGEIFDTMLRYLQVGNTAYMIGPGICSSGVAIDKNLFDFSSFTYNRHLYNRGEVRTVTAGKCRYFYTDSEGICMAKGLIYQKCSRSTDDGKVTESCYDLINHRKLKHNDEVHDVSKVCPRMQKQLFESQIRNEKSEKWELEVVDHCNEKYFRAYWDDDYYYFKSLVKGGYQYTRKEPRGQRTCSLDQSAAFDVSQFYSSMFVDGSSEKGEFNQELDCQEFNKPETFFHNAASSCINSEGFVKKFCQTDDDETDCFLFKDHKVVERSDKRLEVDYTCEMPKASTFSSLDFRFFVR